MANSVAVAIRALMAVGAAAAVSVGVRDERGAGAVLGRVANVAVVVAGVAGRDLGRAA